MNLIERAHERRVRSRRVTVLSERLAALLPRDAELLEVGSGDGRIAAALTARRPDVRLRATDPLVRSDPSYPIEPFDGRAIPWGDESFDVVLLVDVLHHSEDPVALLREARRVSRRWILMKDHTRDGFLAGPTLRFMDRVGNRRHGVPLPYRYLSLSEWHEVFARLDLHVEQWHDRLGLYPRPLSWVFERSLHFVALLAR